MFSPSVRRAATLALLLVAGSTSTASAQLMYGDPCGCPAPCGPSPLFGNLFNTCNTCCAPAPQVACAPAPQPIAIPQVSYRQVPVTEYRPVKQTVQRPVVETAMVDQPVTEYRTVYETQTAQVPTVQYQNVTEYRTVQRDCGRWVSQQVCRQQVSPCEYDNRPDLFGMINRNLYKTRMAFTPKVYTQRTYVPNVQTVQIPYTRQVAIHGTKQVAYQTAKMVPYTTTRKVAVNQVRMVAQEVEIQQPVTVMKTVPVTTTAYAWGYPGMDGTATATAFGTYSPYTATALAPTPYNLAPSTAIAPPATRTARGPTPATPTPAAPTGAITDPDLDSIKRSDAPPKTTLRTPATFDEMTVPVEEERRVRPAALAEDDEIRVTQKIVGPKPAFVAPRPNVVAPVPTAVRANSFAARRRPAAVAPQTTPAPVPAANSETISVAKRGN